MVRGGVAHLGGVDHDYGGYTLSWLGESHCTWVDLQDLVEDAVEVLRGHAHSIVNHLDDQHTSCFYGRWWIG